MVLRDRVVFMQRPASNNNSLTRFFLGEYAGFDESAMTCDNGGKVHSRFLCGRFPVEQLVCTATKCILL